MRSRPFVAVALTMALGSFCGARAEEDDKTEKEFPALDKVVTKDHVLAEGFWDIHYRQKDQALLATIPSGELEKPFLFTTSLSGGAPQAGWQLLSTLVAWERLGKKLVLVEKNVQYRAEPEKPIADAVVRTYSDRVVFATQILAESPKGYVVDLKDVLVNHARDTVGFSIDGSLAKVTKRKSFPQNIEVAFSAPLSGDGTLLSWHYSIAKLPETGEAGGYHPRVADDRVGYFLTAVKDYTKGDPAENRFVRLVNRWNLQKAQPELALSPPKKPIVFYIEKTVPFRYRRWVEAGILEWNKAFEKCGFSGAVVVRQQTADNEFKDFDPEDARYNFFRWVVNDEGYAMGPSRVDPRTGQILDADIIFDDSMVEFYAGEYETLLKDGPQVYKGAAGVAPEARAFADKLSTVLEPLGVKLDADRACSVLAGVPLASGPAKTKAELQARLRALVPANTCRIGEGVRHQLALGAMKFAIEENADGTHTKGVPEEFWGEVVKETVMHEVGHTLGLRHNFKASSYRTLEDINSEERPGDVSGSVMDYNSINIAPEGRPQGHYQNVLLGPYDVWAIEYGYMVPKDLRPDLEPAELVAIAQRSNERGHAYGTDEDLSGADPLCAQWDMGQDPLAYAKARLAFAKKLREKLLSRGVKQGESWERLRRAFEMVLFEQARAGYYAARLVGAAEVRRNHKGDPGEKAPLELVSAERQRAALQFACEQVFDDKAFQVSPELLVHLGASHWDHWGADAGSPSYPFHERVLMAQRYTLNALLSEGVFARLRDAQARTPASDETLTVSELFGTIEKAIFKELDGQVNGAGPRSPAISNIRQNLQDLYLRRLTDLTLGQQPPGVLPSNAAAKKLAALHVKQIAEKAQAFLTSSKLDEDSRAHLEALAKRADQVRGAEYVHIASGAGCALARLDSAPGALAPLAAALLLLLLLRSRSQ